MDKERTDRILAELEAITELKKSSAIFDFVPEGGDPPEKITLTFNGKGVRLKEGSTKETEIHEVHQIEVRFPFTFPDTEPDLRWITPIFHPNISFSGFVDLDEIGIEWTSDITLDVICDRLWDVARLAHMDQERSSNYTARNWYKKDCNLTLPVDHRPLRNRSMPSSSNVVKYQRRGDEGAVARKAVPEEAVLFIGDEAPVMPEIIEATPGKPPIRSAKLPESEGDGIVFID